MLKVGLTGGIGSGKSTVANIFNVLKIPVFNADKEAKILMETDPDVVRGIKKTFGEESYIEGKLNRSYLAGLVFKNQQALIKLNALVHPATIAAALKWMQQQTSAYVIKEAALMFESGSAEEFDYVIGVYSPADLRMKRIIQRDNLSREDIFARMENQMDEALKMKLCNFIIVNDETQFLIPQVLDLHDFFMGNKNMEL